MQEDFHQEDGNSSSLDQKKKWQTTRRMGQSRWIDDDKIWRKRTPNFPCHESTVPRNAQKAKEVENYQYTSALMVERLKLFFAQLFLLISSASTEQSQIVWGIQSLPCKNGETWCWEDNLTHCLCQQVCWWKHLHLRPMILREKIYCKSTKYEWKGSHNKIVWQRFVLMQDFWQQLESDSTSWRRTLENSHNSQNQWYVVSTFCQQMKKSSDPKGWIRGNTRIWSGNQNGICKQRQFSLVGQNFSWLE